jgi:hypothetical protein
MSDASSIWGVEAVTVGRILREVEKGAGVRTIIRIGRAGEKMVRYACAVCETYRHFRRLGLGAGGDREERLAGLRACILNYLHLLIHGLYEVAIIKSLSKFKREGSDK